MNRKGQVFVQLIIFVLGFIMFIFASPIIAEIINLSVSGMGSATAFVVKTFLWIIMFVFVATFLRIISSGGGFFTE